jgi:allantoate deiminase
MNAMALAQPPATASRASGGARAVARCRQMLVPPFSDSTDGLYRAYLTPAHAAACRQLEAWMGEAGMSSRIDPAGNVVGRYEGSIAGENGGPVLLIGSHIDSVRDGGAFDGPLGIVLGIECVAALHERGTRLPFPIEVIAFGDEEGSRFPAAMLTSRAAAGLLAADRLAIADPSGLPLGDALAGFGLSAEGYLAAAYVPGAVRAYIEAHIEQGPVLEAEGLPLGVVTAIAGQRRFTARMTGVPGHAGTNSMVLRRDALAAAAEAIAAIERVARAGADDLVATVGSLQVAPGSANVVPGRVDFTIDVRAGSDPARDTAVAAILAEVDAIAATRGIGLAVEEIQTLPATPCDPALIARLDRAVAATGVRAFRLVSGAGHDAMNMAAIAPIAMLFIRSPLGISHNPAEDVAVADVELALQAMLGFIEGLGDE